MPQRPVRSRHWSRLPGIILLSFLVFAGLVVWVKKAMQSNTIATASPQLEARLPPRSFAELCALSPDELAQCDIGLMNLLCAEGLPGAERLIVTDCLAQLDRFAQYIKSETLRNYHQFVERPQEFRNSEGYYEMMMMVTVLQQDLKIRYNPVLIQSPDMPLPAEDHFFDNSQDIFIHGLIRDNGMGTCSSMPVFLVALGRRLGYPLKLVKAKSHLFARWEQGEKSFNIEGTGMGFNSHSDSEYRNWPFPFTAEEERTEGYLKAMTPAQELSVFLSIRGMCLRAHKDYKRAVGAFAQAYYKEPQSVGNQKLSARAEREAYQAGALPKRTELQYAIRTLEIPDGPRQAEFIKRKAMIEIMNQRGGQEAGIEGDLAALNAEIRSDKMRNRCRAPNEPQPGIPPLQPAPAGLVGAQIGEQK